MCYSADQGAIKGDPELPLTAEDVRAKFMRYASGCVSAASAARFVDQLLQGPPELRLQALWALLEPT